MTDRLEQAADDGRCDGWFDGIHLDLSDPDLRSRRFRDDPHALAAYQGAYAVGHKLGQQARRQIESERQAQQQAPDAHERDDG